MRSSYWIKLLLTSALSLAAGCSRAPLAVQVPASPAGGTAVEGANSPRANAPNTATSNAATPSADADVQTLVSLGPRVAGTPVMEQARSYLAEEYRKAGYVTEVQTFTYSKFEDQGSELILDSTPVAARALRGSIAGRPTARLVAVPNFGRPEDFAQVEARGAIAIVQRGEIRFLEKANNAAAAGAIGLVIVNFDEGGFAGSLGGEIGIPVISLSGEQGNPLLERAARESLQVTLNANAVNRTVTGHNIIAHLEGVTQPEVLLGAHYDSVAGSPGANDNASGTAVILDIARNVAQKPIAQRVWFVAFDGEEDGLHGSRSFVDQAQPQFLSGLESMLNFDMVGANEALQVGGTSGLTALVKAVDASIITFAASGNSDHAPFARAEVPILFFTRGADPNYHSPTDTQVDPKLLDQTTQTAIEVVEQLMKS
ncbi:M28 family peptidase [Phormidium tenue FACHB-886]|nr:M28 family peptidase [Phormidium tenue FACHB-886]